MTAEVQIGTTRQGVTELTRHWPAANPWAGLLIVHGLGEHSGRYQRTGQLFAQAGITTWAFDLQGFGASGGRRADISSWNVYQYQVADNLGRVFSTRLPTVLLGHSLGGLIAVSYTFSLHRQPDLVVLTGPALEASVAGWKRMAAGYLGRLAPSLPIPNGLKPEMLSQDPAVGQAYLTDPLVVTKTKARLGAVILKQMEDFARAMDGYSSRTFIAHGGQDQIVPVEYSAPLEALDMVERKVYPDLRHEVLNEPQGPQVVEDIVSWIRQSLPAA